jgi:hypothetical protein
MPKVTLGKLLCITRLEQQRCSRSVRLCYENGRSLVLAESRDCLEYQAGIMPPHRQFQREIASDSVLSEPRSMQRWRAIEIGVDEL